MLIGAQEWRVRTGLINACHTVKVVGSNSKPQKSTSDDSYLPPPTWKGWRALVLMVAAAFFCRAYTFIVAIILHVIGVGESLKKFGGIIMVTILSKCSIIVHITFIFRW